MMYNPIQSALYIVATPLGNLADITLRALEILKTVDLILAEDTRQSLKLLKHYQIQKPMLALHEHNEEQKINSIIELLEAKKSIALISDAGTPLINDPGFHLVRSVQDKKFKVIPIPGASAIIAALSASGLPTDRFCFQGFLPSKNNACRQCLEQLQPETRTLIFFEAPHRILETLTTMVEIFGAEREAVLAREITKTFETIKRGSLTTLLTWIKNDSNQVRGEMVLLVAGFSTKIKNKRNEEENLAESNADVMNPEAMRILKILLAELPKAQAASIAAKITGIPKRILYDKSLAISES